MSEPTNDIRERMQETARYIQTILPPNTGFIFCAFDYGPGTFEYISNAERGDVIKVLENFIKHSNTEWMKHSKERV